MVRAKNLGVNQRRLDREVTEMVSLRLCNPPGGSRLVNLADCPRARRGLLPACWSIGAAGRRASHRRNPKVPSLDRSRFSSPPGRSARQAGAGLAPEGGNQPLGGRAGGRAEGVRVPAASFQARPGLADEAAPRLLQPCEREDSSFSSFSPPPFSAVCRPPPPRPSSRSVKERKKERKK